MRWIRRLVAIAVFGYAGGEIGLLLGMSEAAHQALLKSVGLVLHLCLAWLVLRNRRAVRAMIRGPDGAMGVTRGCATCSRRSGTGSRCSS